MDKTRKASSSRPAKIETPHRHQWTFYYDGNCSFCTGGVAGLSRLDFFRQVRWMPFQSLEEPPRGLSWEHLNCAAYLDTGRDQLYEGFYSLRMLTLRLPLLVPLAPVLWAPGVNLLGPAVYRWIARNRYLISRCLMLISKAGRHSKGRGSG